jgi:hypothetical protein
MNLSPRTKLRLLGVLPLIFFLAQSVHYWRTRELGNLMWMCNIGNLLLAMGLFLEKPVVVRLDRLGGADLGTISQFSARARGRADRGDDRTE